MTRLFYLMVPCVMTILGYGQDVKWAPEKKGSYRLESYLSEKTFSLRNAKPDTGQNKVLKKNVAAITEWFHQNHPMLKTPVGYDVRAINNWVGTDYTTKTGWIYGIPATVSFLFELFDAKGGKWTIEPPQYRFDINAVYGGHGGFFFTPESIVDDGSRYDLSLSVKVSDALAELMKYFTVLPLKEQPCPGVDVYGVFENEWQENARIIVVVYNPDNPRYWLPVSVRELADAHLAYFSLIRKQEIDRMLLDELKKEIAGFSAEELAAPAFTGHHSNLVFRVNGNGQGHQIMRFNPAYWNKSLPVSAVQFMTFNGTYVSEEGMAKQGQRSYPDYPVLFFNQIKWEEIARLIAKK